MEVLKTKKKAKSFCKDDEKKKFFWGWVNFILRFSFYKFETFFNVSEDLFLDKRLFQKFYFKKNTGVKSTSLRAKMVETVKKIECF